MKVRCVKYLDPNHDQAWIRLNEVYDVLCLLVSRDGEVEFRLLGIDGGTPAIFKSAMFETVDASMSPNWAVRLREEGGLVLAPARWLVDGFWEDFFDGVPEAEQIFDDELAIITGERRSGAHSQHD